MDEPISIDFTNALTDHRSTPADRPRAPTEGAASRGLAALASLTLDDARRVVLEAAAARARGTASWRARKIAEARDLLALSQIAPPGRLIVEALDLADELRALLALRVPVPCRPGEDGRLGIANLALLGLTYWQEAIRRPMPGFAFLHVLAPQGVWHPNAAPEHGQPLCLGALLPAGIPVKEIVLLAYGLLSMQSVMLDERDAAGVLNADAARWWQFNLDKIPLSRTPFLGEEGATP